MLKTIANSDKVVKKVEGLFHIIPFTKLRKTQSVEFDAIPFFSDYNWIDVVKHEPGARSPGKVEWEGNHWYMHPFQEDNLITLHGNRFVELYSKEHGKIEKFEISDNCIKWNWEVVLDGPWILGWPCGVFHRNYSPNWSVSMNLAIRNEGFDVDTEFNIYNVDTNTWEYSVARVWKLDQDFS